jgi:hypothetical protein
VAFRLCRASFAQCRHADCQGVTLRDSTLGLGLLDLPFILGFDKAPGSDEYSTAILSKTKKRFTVEVHEVIFTTFHFLHYSCMGQITLSVCPWQAFPVSCNVTL